MLDSVSERKERNETLSVLETNGVLHSLQIIIENAIGKAKHLLKYYGVEVPVSSHDAFEALWIHHMISDDDMNRWRKVIGFRNTIVNEYMNVDLQLVDSILLKKEYQLFLEFLKKPFDDYRPKSENRNSPE